MGSLGFPELMVVLVIALVVFGAGRLPEVGSALGKAIRGFKEAVDGREARPAAETRACPACGQDYAGMPNFCPQCGQSLRPAPARQK